MKWLLGAIGYVLVSGCATTIPRCVPPAEEIVRVEAITNTPCAAKIQKKDGSSGTYVILHSTLGYLGEELP